ncbi:Multidrug resistance-associated protein 1 [Coemansia sp. S16]|nr:Multidrug resistance-associated protein 1 [Coemansia sp. S16]
MSSLLGGMAYPVIDAAVALSAIYFTVRDKRSFSPQLVSPFSHMASALLVVIAVSHYSGWTRTLNQVASFALPLLAAHPSGYTVFQLANALGIYRLLCSNANPLTSALCVLLHVYLVLANLDRSSQAQLKSIMHDVSYSQVRQLNILQKLRALTLDDMWSVPERFQLRHAYAELVINADEPLFLIRAIARMIWKPMIPIHIAGMMFQLLPIFRTMLNGYIYRCLDSSDGGAYYKAYMAAAGLILSKFLAIQKSHLNGYITRENSRVKSVLELELVRKPLLNPGLKMIANKAEVKRLGTLVNGVRDLQEVIPCLFGTLAAVLPIYNQIGWYAFIPLVVSSSVSMFEWVFQRLMGSADDWNRHTELSEGDKIEDVYFSINTVKMFGWENMYLDPKLRKNRVYLTQLPWYAPLVRFGLTVVDIVSTLTTDLSMYMTVVLYLNAMPTSDMEMTNSQLLAMTEHIESMRRNVVRIFWQKGNISRLIKENTKLEQLFRGETFDTIAHEKLGELEAVPSIQLDNCSFRWEKKANLLNHVTLNATDDDLVAVVGKTGSGKSSLLLAMCGELEMTKGSGTIVGRIGYMEQSPWIMNDTMRANILFGRDFDEEYYWKVIHACALTRDLESWPNGDLTIIGERGINISGGQRARLALARTVYSQADVYILDDPLSAVDAHVKRHILDNVILGSGLLGNKLRIVTTHSESMLPFCSQVVTVDNNTVSVVRQEPKVHRFIDTVAAVEIDDVCVPIIDATDVDSTSEIPTANADAQASTSEDTSLETPESDEDQLPSQKYTLLDNAKYMFGLCGWHVIAATVISAAFSPIAKFILEGYNIAALKENSKSNAVSHDAVLWYLKISLLKTVTSEILDLVEEYVCNTLSEEKLTVAIQDEFVRSLLHAPLSVIEKADRHDIESAHDDGSSAMAYEIPRYLREETANTIKSTQNIIGSGSLMVRMFGVESHYISRYTSDKDENNKISRPLSSLKVLSNMVDAILFNAGDLLSIWSAIILSHLTKYKANSGQLKMLQDDVCSITLNIGLLMKVPSRLNRFSDDIGIFRQFSDIGPEAPYVVDDCRVPSEWPNIGNVEFKNLSVKYGAGLDYALKNLNFTARPGEKIGIVGRTGAGKSTLAKTIFRLLNKNIEGSIEIDGHDTSTFGVGDFRPRLGIIPQESAMFSGTVKRNLDPLNEFTIEDMWAAMIKCGVAELVGSTNNRYPNKLAGKKSIANNKNNSNRAVESGTENEEEKSYRLRWENAGLIMRILLLLFAERPKKSEDSTTLSIGINRSLERSKLGFSSGQQQLFSLCRLLMRKRKVMILDEATADVDLETDRKIQELIRTEFSDCTVLTIAHRLDTIMNSDRIIVMEKGEIVEIGPPQELIANGGKFAELVQANEF